ncbi:hypothetical protein [Prevotella sp. S7 MS 2]|uniref:hypothetical protein n=1 Tax=Prevotella sp. S7 MS 2 TaxID=1287488 RepID=UPI000513EE1A|nr:hypothetical protein [Prevotella sp. S7 MS 2]KGI60324.1 hypothetical protein HMPREF0671_06695 [Prevotella sp. S7 MS 2]
MKNNVSGHPDERKNGKNCKFLGRNHQKSLKTANSVDGIVKKQRKLQILWTESSEIDENCKFRGQNHQKTEKTGFPHPGEVRITHFLRFPTLGKIKITRFLRFSLERKAVVAHRKRP